MTGILLREEALKELVIYYSRNKAQRDRGNDYVLGIGLFVPLAPFACFARPENRKMSGFSPKIAIFGPKRSENGVFMRFLTIFRLRDPLRLVSVDDFLPEA